MPVFENQSSQCQHPGPGDMVRTIRRNVHKRGWHFTGVLSDGMAVPYVYTTGLYRTWGHPELVITGLPAEVAPGLVADVADRVADGRVFKAMDIVNGIVVGFPVHLRQVPPAGWPGMPFTGSRMFYDGQLPAVLQIVWPDKHGRFPGQPGCDPAIAAVQMFGPDSPEGFGGQELPAGFRG